MGTNRSIDLNNSVELEHNKSYPQIMAI